MAQNTYRRRSAIHRRTVRYPGFAASYCIRKRIDKAFAWIKTVIRMRKTNCAAWNVDWAFASTAAAYNRLRLVKRMAVSL